MTNWNAIESTLVDLLVEVRLAQRAQITATQVAKPLTAPEPALTGTQLWQRERKAIMKFGGCVRTAQFTNGKGSWTLGESGSRYSEYTLFIRLTDSVLKSVSKTIGYNLSNKGGVKLETARRLAAGAADGATIQLNGIQFKVIKK